MRRITVLEELTEAHFENAEWLATFKKYGMEEELLMKVSNDGLFNARLWQSLSDICRARKRTAENIFSAVWVSESSIEDLHGG